MSRLMGLWWSFALLLGGPVVQSKPWLEFVNGQDEPGPMLAQLLGLVVLMTAGSSSQSVQSIQLAL